MTDVEEKELLLPGKGNDGYDDDDDEDFGPLEETVKDNQDYGWDWEFKKSSTRRSLLQKQKKKTGKRIEKRMGKKMGRI